MADVTLTYKGNTIAELNDSGSKTLLTAGKFCDADIGVEYVKPSGGGGFTKVASYTTTADAITTETDGNTLAFYNTYIVPHVTGKDEVMLLAKVSNNEATGNYAKAAWYWGSQSLRGNTKHVKAFWRNDSNAVNNTTTAYEMLTTAGTVIDIYLYEGVLT